MNKGKSAFQFFGLLAVLLSALTALGQVEGPNGHFYQVVMEPGVSWEKARDQAREMSFNGIHGHLATITSVEEDLLVEDLRQQAAPPVYGSLWIGGWQEPSATRPADGWFWVNGEGPIPIVNGGAAYANWQPGEPNDYWGSNSERYLSTGHFNMFGWNDEPNDGHIHGFVVEFPNRGRTSTVTVRATDPSGTETPAGAGPIDTVAFEFSRDGNLLIDLPVFFSIHGTAINGVDYYEISKSVIIPAGQSSVRLNIVPKPDPLDVIEPMETLGLRIEPSLILTDTASYYLDALNREAAAVIYETAPPEEGALEIAVPKDGFVYKPGEPVTIIAALFHTDPISEVSFYAGEVKIGAVSKASASTRLNFFKFAWTNPPAGPHVLTARAAAPDGKALVSSEIQITVQAPPETTTVGIRFVEPVTAEPWPDADFAPGHLQVTRSGPTDQNLQVYYSVGGSATADVDYEALQGYVVIAAGRTSARITVIAKDDLIDEPNETVVVTLLPVPMTIDPPAGAIYEIDPEHAAAEVVIYDNDPDNALPVVTVTSPTDGTAFIEGDSIGITAEASDADGAISHLELLVNGVKVAETNRSAIKLTLPGLRVGPHAIQARAVDNLGAATLSAAVRILVRDRDAVSFVQRLLPGSYTPGAAFRVTLRVTPPAGAHAHAVEDRPPAGWQVTNPSDDGFFDRVTGKVKFGPFIDTETRNLTYDVTPPASALGRHEFTGHGSLNGALYPITGDSSIELILEHHPADMDRDFAITLAEMTAYTAAWKAGDGWPMGPTPIPVSYVTSSATLWQRGEAYRFDPSRGPAPSCWIPVATAPRASALAAAISDADRSVAPPATPDGPGLNIQINVRLAPGATSYAVEEAPPAGWIVSNISHEGKFDSLSGKIRWGVFIDNAPRQLSYTVTPPPGVASIGAFKGEFSFDGRLAEIGSAERFAFAGVAPIRINQVVLGSTHARLQVSGPNGQPAVVEFSSDLANWTELKSIFLPGGATEVTDDSARGARNRFYRLRVQ